MVMVPTCRRLLHLGLLLALISIAESIINAISSADSGGNRCSQNYINRGLTLLHHRVA